MDNTIENIISHIQPWEDSLLVERYIEELEQQIKELKQQNKELIEMLQRCAAALEKYECDDCNCECGIWDSGCEIKESRELLQKIKGE